MKREMYPILFGIVMGIIWSIVFTGVLKSPAGIGIGICFGESFYLLGRILFLRNEE